MDAMAYMDQRRERRAEESYQLGLERAATGAGQLASMVGNEKANDAFSFGLTALARGGLAEGRRPYLVGEKGPELMVPDQSGTIIPNHKLQVLARALKKRTIARAKGGPVKAGGEPDPSGLDTVDKDWPAPLKAQVEREASFAAGAASLGSPESYGGGVRTPQPQLQESQLSTGAGGYDPSKPSFSNPVAVMRRMAQTYTGPEGGQEYRSLAEANQAFIRGQGGENAPGYVPGTIPGYDPVKGPEIRATGEAQTDVERAKAQAYNKQPQLQAAADVINSDQAAKVFEQRLKSIYGEPVTDDKGNTKYVLPPAVSHAAGGYIPKTVAEVDAAMEKMKPVVETAKTINMFTDPAKSDPARAKILKQYRNERPIDPTTGEKQPVDPATEKYIMTAPVGAHNAEYFRTLYQRSIPKPVAPPAAVPAATVTAPAARIGGSAVSGLSRPPSLQELGQRMAEPFM